ncbi:MAG: phosphomannomutase/phosphoglucomutase [Proteobacteria bacterium]|nr:phosphomannomutase/phosphoglucomutase [Pseudomonadota bacterium]
MTLKQQEKYDVSQVRSEIFRACDIRGVVDETITPHIAFLLGLSFGTLAQSKNQSTVIVGRDGRHSGAILLQSLSEGLMQSGCCVIDLGMVPTPLVYFATNFLNTGTGIMVTGSHNPSNYNGFKMMLNQDTLALEQVQSLYEKMLAQEFVRGKGTVKSLDIIEKYIERIKNDIHLARKLKIVVDCGSGVVGVLAEKLFTTLGCEVIPLYCEVNGDFPFHHPDPGQPKNLQDLIKTVKHEKADLGIAFDGDGDRLGLVTDQGEIVWPDRLMMLFVEDLLKRQPGSHIIYDVKCSRLLADKIVQCGGIPVMYKTGHALIKRKMLEVNAMLAGEMSGHFFFKERWYGFDDACYAAARLLEIISKESRSLSHIFHALPNSISTPEINIAIHEDKKFGFIESLKTNHPFHDAKLITVDGVRAEFEQGWGLVRASNTTPCLVLRFEAETESALQSIQAMFKQVILTIAPELEIPF